MNAVPHITTVKAQQMTRTTAITGAKSCRLTHSHGVKPKCPGTFTRLVSVGPDHTSRLGDLPKPIDMPVLAFIHGVIKMATYPGGDAARPASATDVNIAARRENETPQLTYLMLEATLNIQQ
jgi:hypothetical protein